jgi:hypothetical protein
MIQIDRSSYHWLNLKATVFCAFILLDRSVHPDIRTSPEAQAAARETLRIIQRLRDAGMLHNPHSMFSPFPVFVAGIEVDDPVYQEWTLKLLDSFQGWGMHTRRVGYLLRQVIRAQEEKSRRVSIEAVARDNTITVFL